jgi:hypothetical protein
MIGAEMLREWKLCKTWAENPYEVRTAKQMFIGWLRSRNFKYDLLYEGNYALQLTVIVALLFAAALYLINRKLGKNASDAGRNGN